MTIRFNMSTNDVRAFAAKLLEAADKVDAAGFDAYHYVRDDARDMSIRVAATVPGTITLSGVPATPEN